MAWLSATGGPGSVSGSNAHAALGEDIPLINAGENEQVDVITRLFKTIAGFKDEANFVLPATLSITAAEFYANRSNGWVVLPLVLLAGLQFQLLVSMNASKEKRANVHEAAVKIALGVFMIFWFIYIQNSKERWAQDLMVGVTFYTAACFSRQIYDVGVKLHQLITRPSFKALDLWAGKTIEVPAAESRVQTYWERVKENGFYSNCLQTIACAGAASGLIVGGRYLTMPGRFLTDLPGWLLVGIAIALPLSLLFISKVEHEKIKIDKAWKEGQSQAPVLNRTVKQLIVATGVLEAGADVVSAVAFVYSIKQNAFKVATISGSLLALKAVQTWQSLTHRTLIPVDERVLHRAIRIARVCTILFGLAIPAYTITMAAIHHDKIDIMTAANILVFSYLAYFASTSVQRSWTPQHPSQLLRVCRYILSEYPDLFAYTAAACNHAGKIRGMPGQYFLQQAGWMMQSMTIGLNIADISDFLHDPQKWQEPRLSPLAIMYNVAWAATIPEALTK